METTPATDASTRRQSITLFVLFLFVVVSVVPWRRGDIYSGGADSVVIAKALVGIVGFGLAFLVHRRSRMTGRMTGRVGVRSLSLFAGIVIISTIGAAAAGNTSTALVLTIRIILVAATVVVITELAPRNVVLGTLLAALGAVAVVSAVTGAAQGLTGGRLSGGIPQMAPNVLAGLAAPPAIGLAADIVRRGIRPTNSVLIVVQLAIVFATGSRTTLIVAVIGIALALIYGKRVAMSTAIATIIAAPLLYLLVTFTDTVGTALTRGQTVEQISTLSQRTVAWQAVLATPFDSWAKWIGVGLAAKTVAVQAAWRDVQVLDSSWVSVIAQAGIIGTVLLIVWITITTVESARDHELRALAVPLVALLIIRSFTENGLIESSPTFMILLTLSLVLEPGTVFPRRPNQWSRYRLAATPLPAAVREHSTT